MAIEQPLAIEVKDVGFGYPDNPELSFEHLNLKIAKGERFGLFGPNGAGKTTLMNLMTGVLRANSGGVALLGHEVGGRDKSINKLFGFVPQDFSYYQELTPAENLEFFGAWSGLSSGQIKHRIDELLEILGLQDVKNKQVQKFSGGMKRRVNLAIGVIHNPPVLFLDEPTVGVDVQTRHAIISYLRKLNDNGTTLVYTSHQLSEAEDLCNEVALLDGGQIITQGGLHSLLAEHGHQTLEDLFINLTGREYRN